MKIAKGRGVDLEIFMLLKEHLGGSLPPSLRIRALVFPSSTVGA